jgi:hypothetical protein
MVEEIEAFLAKYENDIKGAMGPFEPHYGAGSTARVVRALRLAVDEVSEYQSREVDDSGQPRPVERIAAILRGEEVSS